MSFFTDRFLSRFKKVISISDLRESSEKSFKYATDSLPEIFELAKEKNPRIEQEWEISFNERLLLIAGQPTKKEQARECRRQVLENIEKLEVTMAVCFDIEEPEIARMFYVDESIKNLSDDDLRSYEIMSNCKRCIDSVAYMLIYKTYFNRTLSFDSFNGDYTEICKIATALMRQEYTHQYLAALHENEDTQKFFNNVDIDSLFKYYIDVVDPALTEILSIKKEFSKNILFINPEPIDNRPLINFKERMLKQIKSEFI
ncbi:MAG: hypothetical protein Q8N30_14220 [Methylococcales bacterium]|nr:hypothetical protein [Methylococcales bacterium]